ncbi:LacI family DNA-binding transcriptional regulator [Luedemannella helvata]|uniref:LacI family DNA-binding transcriptional regulator n=1 Tax=Luedemannella helvata TaxID=349315 RepID=A0ABN2JXN1_9ACTN
MSDDVRHEPVEAPVSPAVPERMATMMDVAKLAGVSHQTVSRVLNDQAKVSPETRARVLDAMRQLDYQPNSAARALVTRRSKTLGLVTFDTTLFGPASMVYGIEQAARDAGYFVSIASIRTLSRRAVLDAIGQLRLQSVEGIVAIVPKDSAVVALSAVPPGIALVGVGVGGGADVPMVGVDNVVGAALATRHLLSLGHRTVYHISGPPGWPEARERTTGWREALTAYAAPAPPVLVGDWSARSGYLAAQRLATDPSVTAVFCANDQMALGALRALHEVGRRVPADVSVVGFDDVPEGPYLIPPLTTVQQDFAEVGRRSLALLMEQITTGARPHRQIHLTPQLKVRDSSARAVA